MYILVGLYSFEDACPIRLPTLPGLLAHWGFSPLDSLCLSSPPILALVCLLFLRPLVLKLYFEVVMKARAYYALVLSSCVL